MKARNAALTIDRLRRYIDALHGKGSVRHAYSGRCPDETQPDSRDDECPACRLLLELRNYAGDLAGPRRNAVGR